MTTTALPRLESPFDDLHIEEIDLVNPPLARVLVAIRHPPLTALTGPLGEKYAANVSARLLDKYPIFMRTVGAEVSISPSEGIKEQSAGLTTWRLQSADEAWQISFSKDFIAVETSAYEGRSDFIARMTEVIECYAEIVKPPAANRIGLRFTNRLSGDELQRLPALVQPQFVGLLSSKIPDGVKLNHIFSSALYRGAQEQLLVNWGIIPANGVFDTSFAPIAEDSWVLDIDASTESRIPISPVEIASVVANLSHRCYKCFRWAVTDEFIKSYREV